jgi:hypothetical protein
MGYAKGGIMKPEIEHQWKTIFARGERLDQLPEGTKLRVTEDYRVEIWYVKQADGQWLTEAVILPVTKGSLQTSGVVCLLHRTNERFEIPVNDSPEHKFPFGSPMQKVFDDLA